MKVIFSHSDIAFVGYVKAVLEDCGVPCRLRNEFLSGGAGELPPTECWPEICIDDDAFESRARRIVDDLLHAGDRPGEPWHCPRCGELIEGHFTDCWRCGA